MSPALVLATLFLAIASKPAFAELVPVGHQVTVTEEHTFGATVAIGATGETLVVWTGDDLNGDDDVIGRVYAPDGSAVGTEFILNTYTTGDQGGAAVAADGAGNFIVAWTDDARDGDGSGAYAQRFDASGAPLGPDFAVNSYTTGEQWVSDVAAAPDGTFVVGWSTLYSLTPGDVSARAQLFDASETKIGAEVVLATAPSAGPRVAFDAAANFIVAWKGIASRVDFRRFAAGGSPNGATAETTLGPGAHDVAMMPDGKFVLVWTSDSSLQCDLTARRYDASATPIGPDFLVSTQTVGQEECRFQKVVADSTGGFVVAWQHAAALPSVERDGDRGGIFAQRYDAAGNPDPANLRVNRVRAWEQTGPDVAVDANGNAVVTWSGTALARFCRDDDPSCDRCPGFDDSIDADVDGIPDGCDLCTNVTGDQTMDDDVKVGVLHSDREVFDENDHYQGIVRASGRFRLPGPFATIDPSADGVFVRFAAPDGPMVMSADLSSGTFAGAGTAGWTLGLDGRKWTYRDKTGLGSIFPEYGELKATVEDRSTLTEPNLVRVTVKGKHGIYPTVAEDRTIDVTLVFGGQTASDAGQCAETSFAESDCRFIAGAQDNRIRCKR